MLHPSSADPLLTRVLTVSLARSICEQSILMLHLTHTARSRLMGAACKREL